ncbi:MAG: hypothetical protein H6R16_3657, partial [Proteobacteria bacterium]|nr:hypothetical protein [Pseudomonadota bacterium]
MNGNETLHPTPLERLTIEPKKVEAMSPEALSAPRWRRLHAAMLITLGVLSLLPLPAQSQVSLPNGTPSESAVDLRVKVLGGTVTIDRQFHEGRWQLNLRWRPAVLSGEPQVQGTCTAYPAIIVQD